jgi:hypothetical protein
MPAGAAIRPFGVRNDGRREIAACHRHIQPGSHLQYCSAMRPDIMVERAGGPHLFSGETVRGRQQLECRAAVRWTIAR